jgi:hypothetical protein
MLPDVVATIDERGQAVLAAVGGPENPDKA